MRKRALLIIAIIAFLIIGYIMYIKYFDSRFEFNLSEKGSKVLIDSINLNSSMNLYWFKYENYVGRSSVSFMCIGKSACECNMKKALLKGEFIFGIKEVKNDSIYILSQYGFDIMKDQRLYHFIDVRSDGHSSIRHIGENIYFKDLCK